MATIQEAVIQVTADASGVRAGMAEATKAVKDFESAAKSAAGGAGAGLANANKQVADSAGSLTREQQRLVNEMGRYSERVGRTRGEVLELRAANLGLTQQLQQQITAIKAAEAAAARAGNSLNQYGMSAKATSAALRQVPAQFTDIVVSLQGGTAPLTVLLQQGGQLKDVFGGVAPAFRALTGYVVGLINPFTVLAASVAGLGVAYFQASREQDAFFASIVTTGNYAGTTTRQLNLLASQIDQIVGTRGQAAEALTALVGTGAVGGQDLQRFATVAVRTQRELGVAVADTAKIFAELGKDPVRASERLNESMNYLTLSTLSQIKALEDQGRAAEAANLAQRAYADAMEERTQRLEGNLGIIQRAWRAIADAAREGWDEILGIGRPDGPSLGNGTRALLAGLGGPAAAGGLAGSALRNATNEFFKSDAQREAERETDLLLRRNEARVASEQAAAAATQKAGIEAAKIVQKLQEQTKGTAAINRELGEYRQRIEAIRKADPNSALISPAAIAAGEKAIRDRYKEPAGRRPRAFTDDEATRYLLTQRQVEASLREQLDSESKLTAAQKELAKFNQEIADLKEKRILTADQKSLLAKEGEIRAQLEVNAAVSVQVKQAQEKAKAEKEAAQAAERYAQAVEAVNISVTSSNESRAAQFERTLGAFGRGDRAREQTEAQRQIEREFQRYQDQITKAAARNGQLGSEKYQQDLAAIAVAQGDALAASEEYYARLYEMQANWANGASRALEQYYEQSRNVAGQIEQVFTQAFKGLEDVLTEFFTTGKLDLDSFARETAASVTRSIIQTQITGPLAQMVNGQMSSGSGFGGLINSVFGGLFGSNGTGGGNPGDAAAGAGLLSVATGAGAATAALSALAAAAASASGAMGGSSVIGAVTGGSEGGGGFLSGIGNWFGSLFGRATGGPVEAGGMYRVNENQPEMLSVGNRQYLMMGNQSGTVTPTTAGTGRKVEFTVVQNFPPGTDRKTTAQAAQDMRGLMNQAERIA